MSTRTSGGSAAPPAAADIPGWNDLPRRQLATTAQACCAVFRGVEAIGRVQQKAAHEALARHQVVAERLKEPCQPMELLALQAEMVRFDVQGATLYWQQVASAVVAMQRELLGSAAPSEAGSAADANAAARGPNPFLFEVKGGSRTATHS